MSRYLPTLNAVRVFEAAGRHNSFAETAEELNITHSAVSRHVRGLEKQLGVQLFENISHGLTLTTNGKSYLSAISPALGCISEASEQLKEFVSGTVSVSCEPTFAAKWLMHNIGVFWDKNPEINLALAPSPDLVDFRHGNFDLAIRYCTKAYQDLEMDLICKEPVYPYGNHSVGAIENADDLRSYRLLHEDNGELWSRWFSAAGSSDFSLPNNNPGPQPALLAIEGALAGNGVVLTTPRIASGDVKGGRLRRLSDIGLECGAYYLVYPKNTKKNTKKRSLEKKFCDWLAGSSSRVP